MSAQEVTASAVRLRATRRRWGEDVVKVVLALCALISILTTVGIVVSLFIPAIEFFQDVSLWDFLSGTTWAPLFAPSSFGVLPLVAGTIVVSLCAALVCLPFGLGAAIYLSEYARATERKVLKPTLEILAGIPTVVYGYFALTLISPMLQNLGIQDGVFSALSAALVMGVMLIPTVASLSEGELRRQVSESAGQDASWQAFHVIEDQAQALAEDVQRVRSHPLIPESVAIGGFLYDVDTGLLTQKV